MLARGVENIILRAENFSSANRLQDSLGLKKLFLLEIT
jgi:hypothetical protein